MRCELKGVKRTGENQLRLLQSIPVVSIEGMSDLHMLGILPKGNYAA